MATKYRPESKEGGVVRVRRRDLDKLTTEVMQLRDFLPRVLTSDLIETLRGARQTQSAWDQLVLEREQLRHQCVHLQSRLEAAQTECQKEREEKLLLREQLWRSGAELQQQAEFCSGLGSAAVSLLWSCSSRDDTVTLWMNDGQLTSFLSVAVQTLESFVSSLDEDSKSQIEDMDSHEHQFVLALTGTITNIAAVSSGRDFLSCSAPVVLDTLLKLLETMKPGVFPKLKVLMLMALYNVSISVNGLKYISGNQGLVPVIWTLLDDGQWEVCLHSLRLLQSLLLDEDIVSAAMLTSSVLMPELRARVETLTSSSQPSLKVTAQQTLEDLLSLHTQVPKQGST